MAAVIDSLEPSTAPIGGEDFTLHVIGTGFTADAAVVFTGDAPTTFVSDTELTLVVKPSEVAVPGTYPLRVVQADGTSNQVEFVFTESDVEPPPEADPVPPLVGHCYELCPEPEPCTLPTPWPPFVPPAAT
jgi:IPT/TIG domain-containing protein